MPTPFYGRFAYSRDRGDLPELPLVNMFAEASPVEEDQVILQSRPGITRENEVGSGPVAGLFRRDGVLGGEFFRISGGKLYGGPNLMGSVEGSGPASFAGNETQLLTALGEGLYRTDGSSVAAISFPDDASIASVGYYGGRFIAIRRGTQAFYWSDVLDGSSWPALNYASAENEPDQLLDQVVLEDYLILLGSQSIEFWTKNVGNADLPYTPVQGRVFPKGVRATGCSAPFDNSFAWVSDENIVYRAGNVAERISDSGIEERIKKSATCRVFTFFFEGHEFFTVRLDNGTWAFDAQTRTWCEFASYGRPNWRCSSAITGPYFGDDETGILWRFEGHADDGAMLERRFRGGLPIKGGTLTVDNIRFETNVGSTEYLTGTYANPQMEVRLSRNHARTFEHWDAIPLGAQGEYDELPELRACGMFKRPSFIFEARCTDPIPFRISGVTINEEGGGR